MRSARRPDGTALPLVPSAARDFRFAQRLIADPLTHDVLEGLRLLAESVRANPKAARGLFRMLRQRTHELKKLAQAWTPARRVRGKPKRRRSTRILD